MTNDDKLIAILKAQSMAINNLVDAVNKFGERHGLTWNVEKKDWELSETKVVVNG